MSQDLSGSIALVTGASSGIGAAVARDLAARGARIIAVARRAAPMQVLADEAGAHILTADLAQPGATKALMAEALAIAGPPDILVNAAGLMINGPSLQAGFDSWQNMISVNLLGLMAMTKAALPHLLAAAEAGPRGVADVINISSVAGRQARGTVAAYNASKFGVVGFTEAMRQEFAPRNLRFAEVAPGVVDTALFDQAGAGAKAYYDKFFAGIEKLRPEDVAEAVGYIVTRPRRVAIPEMVIRPTDHI